MSSLMFLCLSILGRYSLPLTINLSQTLTQPSKGISYPVGDLCRRFTKLTLPSALTFHSNPITPKDCYLLHTYHKQVTNNSPACFCDPTVGNFDVSPLNYKINIKPKFLNNHHSAFEETKWDIYRSALIE